MDGLRAPEPGYEIAAGAAGAARPRPRPERLTSPRDLSGVRLVATDIDGTLLRSDYTISPRACAAIAAAAQRGILVVFVTGRPPRWLDEIGTMAGHTGVAVAANGAVTYDLERGEVVGSHPLEPALITQITS